MSDYTKAIDGLYELQKFGIKLGLNSTQLLLERLGNPQESFPCVHLAGTNGKGSVGAMLEAACLRAGVRCGFYTSPHLVRFSERFKIDGREIDRHDVLGLINRVWEVVDRREPPTFFEFVTAMAFQYFADRKVDLAVIETGLGGRLDATNICRPWVSVITNIGLEHQEYLGNTYREIAFEKAGIIKPGVPLVHGVRQPTARKVVESTAAERGAPVLRLGRHLTYRRRADGAFSLHGRIWSLRAAATNLRGGHQPGNAALALGAAEFMAERGLPIGPEHFRAGLQEVNWPGRLEQWPTAQGEPTLWFDGAHNPHAAGALINSLHLLRRGGGPLVMVVGVMADKEVERILGLLLPHADRIVFSRPAYDRAADPRVLAQRAPEGIGPWEVEADLETALGRAAELAGPGGTVLVTGSLFTVGEARAIVAGEPITDLP